MWHLVRTACSWGYIYMLRLRTYDSEQMAIFTGHLLRITRSNYWRLNVADKALPMEAKELDTEMKVNLKNEGSLETWKDLAYSQDPRKVKVCSRLCTCPTVCNMWKKYLRKLYCASCEENWGLCLHSQSRGNSSRCTVDTQETRSSLCFRNYEQKPIELHIQNTD